MNPESCRPLVQITSVLACLAVLPLSSIGPASALNFGSDDNVLQSVSSHQINLEVDNELVSLKCQDARLLDVLDALAHRMNLVVVGSEPLQERLSLEFYDLTLTDAVKRILSRHDYLLRQPVHNAPIATETENTSSGMLWIVSDETTHTPDESSIQTELNAGVIEDLLTSGDVSARRKAVKYARKLDTEAALEPLTIALTDSDAKVRVKAIYGLTEIGGDSAVAALVTTLGDENASVRVEGTYALGRVGNDLAIEHLRYALYDSDRDVRESAVEALAEARGTGATAVLSEVLRTDETMLRLRAIDALEEIGSAPAILVLEEAAVFKEEEVQQAAREALARLGHDSR